MILSDRQIKQAIEHGDIVIDPFDPKALGTNSYDVHLGDVLLTYEPQLLEDLFSHAPDSQTRRLGQMHGLDCKREAQVERHEISVLGYVLEPGQLYLGATKEYTRTHKYVPFLDGKSSVGRLGITIHCTAGRGDVGFAGHWTMEIHVVHPVRVYAGMPIGQLIYFETGDVDVPYDEKPDAKYRDARDPNPQPSRMWKNFK
jgi:dCTP deaminase